jgi:hypothetical protein
MAPDIQWQEPVVHLEPSVDPFQMLVHGALGDLQAAADRGRREPAGEQSEHGVLSRGEIGGGRVRTCPQLGHHLHLPVEPAE